MVLQVVALERDGPLPAVTFPTTSCRHTLSA
jgi:hypothetical protein